MQTTFGVNMVALVGKVPSHAEPVGVIPNYRRAPREVIVAAQARAVGKEERAHISGTANRARETRRIIELIRRFARPATRARPDVDAQLSVVQGEPDLDLRSACPNSPSFEADAIKQEHADVIEG